MGAFDFLSQQQGVRLPDPVQGYGQALTLANLARQNRQGAYQEAEQVRQQEAMRDANMGLAEAQQMGWEPAIQRIAQRNPDAAALMLKYRDEAMTRQAERDNKQSQTDERRFNVKQKAFGDVGNVAFAEAQNPSPTSVSKVLQVAKFYGIDQDLAPPPQDPAQIADWLSGVGNAAIAAKDQLGALTTRRGQDMTQTTAREGHGVQRDNAAMADRRARDIASMTDARAREFNRASFDNAAAVRDAGRMTANASSVAAIRKEFNGLQEVQNFKAAAPVIASARNAPDTPAGDLDLIYAVGKVLDPNSVVREGEMALVIKSGSPLQRFQGTVRYIMAGKGRLPPEQRQELLALLDNRTAQLEAGYKSTRQAFERAADSAGLPKDQIFTDIDTGSPAARAVGSGRVVDKMPMPNTLAEGTQVLDNATGKIMVVRGGKYVPK